jgi:hypothetical protein
MDESSPPNAPDPLRAFLWGKRQSRRHPLAMDVDVRGTLCEIAAMSLDLSACGVLLRVPTAALAPDAAAEGSVDPFLLVETHFRGSCPAHFRKSGVKVHVEVVRLDLRSDEPEYLYLGCRFSRPLDDEQLQEFALAPEDVAAELHALPSEMMDLRAAGDPCICRLYAERDATVPAFEGEVLGIGEDTMCLRVEGHHAPLAALGLCAKRIRVEVFTGDQVEWRCGAWLKTIGFPDKGLSELELGLVLDKAPGPALRQRFRPVEATGAGTPSTAA